MAESSETFSALVNRLGCSGGLTGEAFEPAIEVGETDVIVTFYVAPLDGDLEQTCPGNNGVRHEMDHGVPIGQRHLVNGSCRDGGEAAPLAGTHS